MFFFSEFKKLRKLFSSWYGIVLEMRLKSGKARALADWKLSAKYLNFFNDFLVQKKYFKIDFSFKNI